MYPIAHDLQVSSTFSAAASPGESLAARSRFGGRDVSRSRVLDVGPEGCRTNTFGYVARRQCLKAVVKHIKGPMTSELL